MEFPIGFFVFPHQFIMFLNLTSQSASVVDFVTYVASANALVRSKIVIGVIEVLLLYLLVSNCFIINIYYT